MCNITLWAPHVPTTPFLGPQRTLPQVTTSFLCRCWLWKRSGAEFHQQTLPFSLVLDQTFSKSLDHLRNARAVNPPCYSTDTSNVVFVAPACTALEHCTPLTHTHTYLALWTCDMHIAHIKPGMLSAWLAGFKIHSAEGCSSTYAICSLSNLTHGGNLKVNCVQPTLTRLPSGSKWQNMCIFGRT